MLFTKRKLSKGDFQTWERWPSPCFHICTCISALKPVLLVSKEAASAYGPAATSRAAAADRLDRRGKILSFEAGCRGSGGFRGCIVLLNWFPNLAYPNIAQYGSCISRTFLTRKKPHGYNPATLDVQVLGLDLNSMLQRSFQVMGPHSGFAGTTLRLNFKP